jgi:hypothetical protein
MNGRRSLWCALDYSRTRTQALFLMINAGDMSRLLRALRPRRRRTVRRDRLEADAPEPLFTANVDQNKTIRNQFAVTRDGQRFLLLSLIDREASPFVTVLNWRSLVRN